MNINLNKLKDMTCRAQAKLLILTLVCIFLGDFTSAQTLSVPFEVKEAAGVGSDGYPVTVIIPLKKGAYQDVDRFRIVDLSGNTVPAQFHVLNRWWAGDQSIRHLKVYFQPVVGAYTGAGTGISQYVLQDDGEGNDYTSNLTVSETDSAITITTGPLRFIVLKESFNLVNEAFFDANGDGTFSAAERAINPSSNNGGSLVQAFTENVQYDSSFTDTTVEIEEMGPMQVVIKATSQTMFTDVSNHKHGFAVRIYAYADKPHIKIDYQLQNSAKNAVYSWPLYFERMGLNFDLNLGNDPTVRFGLGEGNPHQSLLGDGLHLVQTDDKDYKLYGDSGPTGNVLKNGEHPEGYIDISSDSLGVTAVTRFFWEQYPNAFSAKAGGDLSIDLFPEGEARWFCSQFDHDNNEDTSPELQIRESTTGLHWLDDMQHVVKEVVLSFHDGSVTNVELSRLAATVDYHPVPVVPVSWYQETKATVPGFGGEVPSTVGSADDTTRTNLWQAGDFEKLSGNKFNANYKFGWSAFGAVEMDRRKTSCGVGHWPGPGMTFLATGDASDYFETSQAQLGELNHRPQWMAGYSYANDYEFLELEETPYCGGVWRDFRGHGVKTLAADYLPGTGIDWAARDDPHAWFQHVEESYYATGNLWAKDWYVFITEFRKPYMLGDISYAYGQPRGSGHMLMNAMQAYRVNGDLDLLNKVGTFVQFVWDTYGHDQTMLRDRGGFQTGFLVRGLIEYLEEVEDYDPQAWAEAFRVTSAWLEWNQIYGNFAHYAAPGVTGSSAGTSLTMVDPQAWYYWHTGKLRFKTQLDQYMTTGVNSSNTPYGNYANWSGQYENRFKQFLDDNLVLR